MLRVQRHLISATPGCRTPKTVPVLMKRFFLVSLFALVLAVTAFAVWASFTPSRAPLTAGGPDIRIARVIRAHAAEVWSVAFSPDSQAMLTASVDGTVKIWRVTDGALLRT